MPSELRCFRRHFTICILFFNVVCLYSPDRNRLQPIPAKQPDHAQHRQPRHTQSRQDIARITRIDHINATHQRQQRVCPLPHRRHAERQNRHQTHRPEYSDFQNLPPQHRTVEQKQNHQPEADHRRHTSICNNLQTVERNIGGTARCKSKPCSTFNTKPYTKSANTTPIGKALKSRHIFSSVQLFKTLFYPTMQAAEQK